MICWVLYDIKKNKLTIRGGDYYSYSNLETKGVPILIQSNDKQIEDIYTGSNAFGVTSEVIKYKIYDYILSFHNLNIIPDSLFNRRYKEFKMSIYLSPKEAEVIADDLRIVVAIKPISYQLSGSIFFDSHEPEVSDPEERKNYSYFIDANVAELILYNKKTEEVLSKVEIK